MPSRARSGRRSTPHPRAEQDRVVLADRLHSAAIHLLRRLRQGDAKEGLSAPRLSALSVVVFGGPLTLGELASAEQVRPPTMTRLVQGLEAEGLVRREVDPDDRRVVRVQATPKGRSLLARGRSRRVATLAADIGMLKGEEEAALRQAVGIIEGMVGRGPYPHPDRPL